MIQTINPATGETVASFPTLNEREIEDRVDAAHRASLAWRHAPIEQRIAVLRRAAELLEERKLEYGRLMTLEMGKPIKAAIEEAVKCAAGCRYYADHAGAILADERVEIAGERSYVAFQPLGVVLAVMPWNFPFWQVVRFAAPALAAGNVGLLKHASNVPQSALAIEEVFREAGLPEGVFQTLMIGPGAVERIVADRRVAAVTFTGSEAAGSLVASAAGKALKKSVLELGGSDPFIVLKDADLATAATVACRGRNQNNGQSCIAAKRFIVEEPVADEFEKLLAKAVGALKVGNPMDRGNQVGPLAREDLVEELERQVTDSVRLGARTVTGGKRLGGGGYYFAPTVLANVRPGMPAYHEETFGPVASVIRVKDSEDALRVANDTDFGLGSAIWTSDVERAKDLAGRVEAGLVFINGMVASDARLPFGGVKRSGYGRELGSYGIKEFVNIQTIWVGPAR